MDNSLLFSLYELKTLEVERLTVEAAEAAARDMAAERARREAEEAERAAAEAERQADETRRRAEASVREQERRAEELRLIQVEARMEERLEQEGLLRVEAVRLETEARMVVELRKARRPLGTAAALAVAAVVTVGGLGTWLMRNQDVADARSRAQLMETYDAERALTVEGQDRARARLHAEMDAIREQLAAFAPKPAPAVAPAKPARTARPAARKVRKKVAAAAHPTAPASLLDGDTPLLGD
jgi:colicin import membrane protein